MPEQDRISAAETASTAEEQQAKHAAEITAGLRAVADLLEEVPAAATILAGTKLLVPVMHESDPVALLAAIARAGAAQGGKVSKSYETKYANVDVTFGPVVLQAYADREQVCERVVVGTETVTKKVKDPKALAAVPEIEVTEEVEQVEWRCRPLLAGESGAGAR